MNLGTAVAAGLAVVLSVAPAAYAQTGPTTVEIRRTGQEGLTRVMEQAIESAFAKSPDFTPAEPYQAAKMVVWLTEPAHATGEGDRIMGRFAVGDDQQVFGQGGTVCPAAQLNVCADLVVERAKRYRRKAERIAR